MVNQTNYVSCPDLWQISFSCEMSNHATMLIELSLALIAGLALAFIFYFREKRDRGNEDCKKLKHLLGKMLEAYDSKNDTINPENLEYSYIKNIVALFRSNESLLSQVLPGFLYLSLLSHIKIYEEILESKNVPDNIIDMNLKFRNWLLDLIIYDLNC